MQEPLTCYSRLANVDGLRTNSENNPSEQDNVEALEVAANCHDPLAEAHNRSVYQ
jgi:hypothetical protein